MDIFNDGCDRWCGVSVDWNEALIGHADRHILCNFGKLLHTSLSILFFTAHYCHPVPVELLHKTCNGVHLPFVTGHRAEEWRVDKTVTEFVAGGAVANLRWEQSYYATFELKTDNNFKVRQILTWDTLFYTNSHHHHNFMTWIFLKNFILQPAFNEFTGLQQSWTVLWLLLWLWILEVWPSELNFTILLILWKFNNVLRNFIKQKLKFVLKIQKTIRMILHLNSGCWMLDVSQSYGNYYLGITAIWSEVLGLITEKMLIGQVQSIPSKLSK